MKTKKEMLKSGWRSAAAAVALSACLLNFTACDKYDLDQNDPAGWGASIYSYLADDGHYTNTVRLIDDLGLKETLAKTGSKTMFVADDDAFARFYAGNPWGVHSYEQLSLSQKKLLLLGAMVNSSYQVDDLASLEGPIEGKCMRRLSSVTTFDSVAVVRTQDLPNMTPEAQVWNKTWKKFAGRNEVLLMNDMTVTPMLHFIERQMNNNKITNDDYNFLYNYTTDRKAGDASVNGVNMIQQNIKCSNGFVHKMAEVVMPLENMAQIVNSKPQVSIYSKLLERFAAPYYIGKDNVDFYNDMYKTNVDSIFQKRYFSKWSQGGTENSRDDGNGVHSSEELNFDPGWNTYCTSAEVTSSSPLNVALQRNMGVMMVPSDAAMQDYWDNGPGKVLKNQYGTWDNVPTKVVKELINNNMQSDFIGTCVPSKFSSILNDANDPMGVTKESIDSVWLACNGAVFLTNKVFSPTSFVSVLYPAVVNESMRIIDWAVTQCQYNVYLNSLNSYYSFFIPSNTALLNYVDPASYGKSDTELWRFHYDEKENTVWAGVYKYDVATREVGDSIEEVRNTDLIKSRLKDVLDNHIVIGNVEDGNTYYKTKGGQEIKVSNARAGVGGMTVEGSLQANETFEPLRVSYIYDQTAQGNGKCYILDGEPIMTTRKTTIDLLREHDEMSEFTALLEGSALVEQIHDKKYACAGDNISTFNTYNYTVYVPTNESIRALQAAGKLPTWDKVAEEQEAGQLQAATQDSLAIENFLQYHIQDGALFIGAKPQPQDGYETAFIGSNGKFVKLYPTLTSTDIIIRTSASDSAPARVVKGDGTYNLMAREYILNNEDKTSASALYTASTAVIHLIDKPLIHK